MNKKLFLLPVAMMLLASCTTPKPTPVPPEPDHDGESVETAFTAAEAIEAGKALGIKSGEATTEKYYIKDVVIGYYSTYPYSPNNGNISLELGSADAKFVAFQVGKIVDREIVSILPADEQAELQAGDTVCIYGQIKLYESSSGTQTWETTDKKTAGIVSYTFGANHVTPERGAVEGTKSVAEALAAMPANKGESTWKTYTVTGKVSSDPKKSSTDNSYNFNIEDLTDSSKKGIVYYVPLADGVAVPKNGDTVVLTGVYLQNYKGDLELVCGQITSVEAGGPVQPEELEKIGVARALELIEALEGGKKSAVEYEITGIVTGEVTTGKSGDYQFTLKDTEDPTKTLLVYYATPKSTDAADKPAEYDMVTVQGYLTKYVKGDTVTPEVASGAKILSIVKAN